MKGIEGKTGIKKSNSQELAESSLEHIIQKGKKIGVGKDGIVFKIDLTLLSKDERHALVENKVITDNEETDVKASKILKIHNPALGDHEFKMQKKAREILLEEENTARIPDTTIALDHPINNETKTQLNFYGANLNDRAEIIIMDYIDGLDLGSIMYNFILEKMGYEKDNIANFTYDQKEQIAGHEIGFERPNLESSSSQEEKDSMRAITFDRNEAKLFKYLRTKGFKLDPVIFEKVDKAIQTLNSKGLYHNDLHKQNVMLDATGEVYIIDFGRAKGKQEGGIHDALFSQKWKGLSLSEEEEHVLALEKELREIEEVQNRLQAQPEQNKKIEIFIKSIEKDGALAIKQELALSQRQDSKFERFLIMLHIAKHSDEIDTGIIDTFVESFLGNEKNRPFEKNKILKLKQVGYL